MNLKILGNYKTDEFQIVMEGLPKTVVFDAEEPDFVLIFQSFSGERRESEVLEIKRRFPITPILAVLGSWCEGETRTGTPLLGVHNMLWYDFAAMAPLEFEAWKRGLPTVWSLPEGALPDAMEMLTRTRNRTIFENFERKPAKIWIESDDFEQFRLQRDIFHTLFDCETFGRFAGCEDAALTESDILVFDFPDFTPATQARFSELKTRFPKARCVTFLEFPRWNEQRQIQSYGADAVFPKPFRIQDLKFFLK